MSFGKGILGLSQQKTASQMNAVAQSEWDRFVSPFLMLAGAEVLYGQMQHVISPQSEVEFNAKQAGVKMSGKDFANSPVQGVDTSYTSNGNNAFPLLGAVEVVMNSFKKIFDGNDKATPTISTPGRGCKEDEKPYLVSFALNHLTPTRGSTPIRNNLGNENEEVFGDPSILDPLSDANSRGLRRLLAMYRRIRDDIVIVGEYLCDPVLGTKSTYSPQKNCYIPSFPDPTCAPSTQRASKTSNLQSASNITSSSFEVHKADVCESPESLLPSPQRSRLHAAMSLRQTINALIAFIDSRCTLILIHAELCHGTRISSRHNSLTNSLTGLTLGQSGVGLDHMEHSNWTSLATRCRSIATNLSPWSEQAVLTKSLNDKLIGESKALDAALVSVNHLAECNFFECVLSTRKLRVLLDQMPPFKDDLPIIWIRSILVRILSIMQVYFAKLSPQAMFPSNLVEPPDPLTKRRSFSKQEESHTKLPTRRNSEIIDFDKLWSEFIASNKNGTPLAVIVARKLSSPIDVCNRSNFDGTTESEIENIGVQRCSWDILYFRSSSTSSCNKSRPEANSRRRSNTPPNLLQKMINNQVSQIQRDQDFCDNWPISEWRQIESVVNEYLKTDADTMLSSGKSFKLPIHFEDNEEGKKFFCTTFEETRSSDPSLEVISINPISSSSPSSINANFTSLTSIAGAAISGHTRNSSSSKTLSSTPTCSKIKVKDFVHIAFISDNIALLVVQCIGDSRQNKKRSEFNDDDISMFLENTSNQLSPHNLFSSYSLLNAKKNATSEQTRSARIIVEGKRNTAASPNHDRPASLWSESGWESKNVLNKLGIRKNSSPIMAPLKSPYIRRQLSSSRQRKKKTKSSLNHGHLDFFLGPELSQML
mmetsp:Transcript_2415/g.4558  ORF Transcript_2415/g.4558 Transcript_2415/m.4558 type:complete len:877 (+) Transcript_2415:785-3415(+)